MSRGLGDVYKRQELELTGWGKSIQHRKLVNILVYVKTNDCRIGLKVSFASSWTDLETNISSDTLSRPQAFWLLLHTQPYFVTLRRHFPSFLETTVLERQLKKRKALSTRSTTVITGVNTSSDVDIRYVGIRR